jgi:hypothetical protein
VTRQTVTTTVREFDEEGRVVKETITTSEYDWPTVLSVTPYVPQYPTYPNTPWLYPSITSQAQSTYTGKPSDYYTINTSNGLRVIDGGDEGEGTAVPA